MASMSLEQDTRIALVMVEQMEEVLDWLHSDNPVLKAIAEETFNQNLLPATQLNNQSLLDILSLNHQYMRILEGRLHLLMQNPLGYKIARSRWGKEWAGEMQGHPKSRGVEV